MLNLSFSFFAIQQHCLQENSRCHFNRGCQPGKQADFCQNVHDAAAVFFLQDVSWKVIGVANEVAKGSHYALICMTTKLVSWQLNVTAHEYTINISNTLNQNKKKRISWEIHFQKTRENKSKVIPIQVSKISTIS